MTLYETLIQKQKRRRSFITGEDFKYFINNRHLLGKFKRFAHLYDSEENEFDIIRANILLQGMANKALFEEEIKNINNHGLTEHAKFVSILKERIVDQPHYNEGDHPIYIPFFSRSLNELYIDNPEKLLSEPYSSLMTTFEDACIDPFDTYGAELYNSYFTSLVKIGAQKHETAYFHYDTFTIYIVNDQGRLDNQIVLFDKYIKRPVHTHMLERITPVVNAYFANDRTGMINALKENKLISSKIQKILLDQKKK